MENNKSDLTNPLSAEKARAEDLSGRFLAIEEFPNGVDIQPVEDLPVEEFIPFEDNTGFEKKEDEDASEEKKEKKHRLKTALKAVVVLVVLCAVAFAGYMVFFRDNSHCAVAVYQKGSKVEVLLDNQKTIELEDVVEAKISTDGNYLVYSQNSSSKTGKFDLRMIELKERSSVKNKGTVAVQGADKGWAASADGSYIYYSTTEEGIIHYYAYVTAKKESESIASNASMSYPPNGDVFYFTRESGGLTQIFRVRLGEKPTAIDNADIVRPYSDNNIQEIFYLIKNSDSTYKVCKVSGDSEPITIAENVSEVSLDDYSVGGNLYYFVKNEANLNWTDFIADEYAYDDSVMKEPKEEDYKYTVGFIFKREKFDESAYNKAKQNYDEKLVRDSIRQALNQADLENAISSEYKMMLFDGTKSIELVSGIRQEDLLAFSKTGTPKIIVQKSEISTENKTNIDALYDVAVTNGAELAADYALDELHTKGYELSNVCKYIFYNGNNIREYSFAPAYKPETASFLFGGDNAIYTAINIDKVHYSIYYSKADGETISSEKQIADSVTEFESDGVNIYYTVSSDNENDNLYIGYPNGKTTLICENAVEHCIRDDAVYVLKTVQDEKLTQNVDLLLFKNDRTEEIDKNVLRKSIVIKEDKVIYLKDFEYYSEGKSNSSGGKMIIYQYSKKTEIGNSVSTIYDVK